ncbi:MAG: recG [Candidatus Saccharibacteria bacterium]|nr:recG [Candidatus Saccharibacteria bacterium]
MGPELAKKYATVGIHSLEDLLTYYPRRYEDYSVITPLGSLKPGQVSLKAQIKQVTGRYVRRGMHITEAIASDKTGSVRLVWFNQAYRAGSIKAGAEYYISGLFELRRQRFSIASPSIELVSDFPMNTARIIPIYRETKGLSSAQIRKSVRALLDSEPVLPETLPAWVAKEAKLIDQRPAYEAIHFPESMKQLAQAKERLGYEEVFELSLASLLNKDELLREKALSIPFDEHLAKQFVSHLPFTLTDAQKKVVWRIYLDMQKTTPMNRLVEGDVGSGKTVVATMAALMALKQGFQVAFMAPTELLARQHAETIAGLLKPLGFADRLALLVGGLKAQDKHDTHHLITSGQAQFIVGTHALIQEKVDMHNLGLVVIDEQHRFGVAQRKKLQIKAGHMPHVLSMTATPIPRSLALTLYGELDISIMDSKPANRKPIVTKVISPNSRAQLYAKLDEQIEQGRQVFIVCPLITDSAVNEQLLSVESVYDTLRKGPFKHRRIGLLHGKLKSGPKNEVMEAFAAHKLDMIVSTTVVEVGVDVPNATVMVIEGAERFGLAQIHQLRGRVGRSNYQGYCYLVMSDSKAPTRRLRAVESSQDGFALADLDLEIRGPGAIYGTLQHGQLDLRVATLTDTKLIARARTAAQEFIDKGENLLHYKQLNNRVQQLRTVTNLN